MNWEAIGAVGETVGALAVLVTLVYLAMQIRQNTKSVQAAVNLPIFDFISLINMVYAAVVRQPYSGFM